jgi:uncharacterized phiE125 gp8 family phage protein
MLSQMMAVRAVRITGPTVLPITLEQAKRHLALPLSEPGHDPYIEDLIEFARDQWELDTGEAVVSSSYTQSYYCWPAAGVMLLRRPVSSITHIKYYDTAGSLQTLASSNYRLATNTPTPMVIWDDEATLPILDDRPEAVVVTYIAGVASAALVPPTVRQALLVAMTHAFEHRGIVTAGSWSEVPKGYESLVRHHMRSTYP